MTFKEGKVSKHFDEKKSTYNCLIRADGVLMVDEITPQGPPAKNGQTDGRTDGRKAQNQNVFPIKWET